MKNKKLKLTDLKVQSFLTSENKINDKQTNEIRGGTNGRTLDDWCTWYCSWACSWYQYCEGDTTPDKGCYAH